jgi:hypothetical protein
MLLLQQKLYVIETMREAAWGENQWINHKEVSTGFLPLASTKSAVPFSLKEFYCTPWCPVHLLIGLWKSSLLTERDLSERCSFGSQVTQCGGKK